jgi:hypothetical protein
MKIYRIDIGKDHFTVEPDDGRKMDVSYELYPRLSYCL